MLNNDLKVLDIDAIRSLSPWDKNNALFERAQWLKRQRRQDRKEDVSQYLRTWYFRHPESVQKSIENKSHFIVGKRLIGLCTTCYDEIFRRKILFETLFNESKETTKESEGENDE